MERALRQTVVIGPGGSFEGKAPGLAAGTVAEIIFLIPEEKMTVTESSNFTGREDGWSKHWAASDRLIADGMETWDIDRVNAEIAARRGGEREVL